LLQFAKGRLQQAKLSTLSLSELAQEVHTWGSEPQPLQFGTVLEQQAVLSKLKYLLFLQAVHSLSFSTEQSAQSTTLEVQHPVFAWFMNLGDVHERHFVRSVESHEAQSARVE
jgi:hypothetical protein